jgi:hypothetical protein
MQHRRNDAAAVIQPMDVNWWGCLLLALSVISLLRSDSVAFGCEADMRTVDRSNQSDVNDPKRTLAA